MQEKHSIDSKVVIIGAGPAGLIASLWLIKSNIPHILIDANTFPRDKSCGDIITSKVIRCINEIDAEMIPNMVKAGLLSPISGTKIYAPSAKSFEIAFKGLDGNKLTPSCYSVKRGPFDEFLLSVVKQSKVVEVKTACFIKEINYENEDYYLHSSEGTIIKTKLIIGASGSNSNVSKLLGNLVKEDKHLAIGIRAYFTGVACREDLSELICDESIFPGGLYITPLSEGVFNVNLVVRKDLIEKKKLNLKKQFEYLLKHNSILKEKFEKAKQISDFKGSGLFLGTKKRKISGNGFMLAGDAAGLIDLISGNGIPQAMISGKFAAEKAIECLETNNFSVSFISSYEERLYKKIKNDLSIGKLVNPILAHNFFRKFVFKALSFFCNKNEKNSALIKLLYSSNPMITLLNPYFYFQLFSDSKNEEGKGSLQLK